MKNYISSLAILLFSLCSTPYAQPVFKHFSDYKEIVPTKHSDPYLMRTHYWAKLRVNDRIPDPAFKDNKWKLVMRRGLYLAQVDKAMSEIYQYFLGYSTDVDLVQEGGDYYIARRDFKHFSKLEGVFYKKDNQYYFKDYLIMDDGSMISPSSVKHLSGLAKVAVLTNFFAEKDAEFFNCGVLEGDTEFRVLQFDNERALSYDEANSNQGADIERELRSYLGDAFVSMTWYKKEKQQMLEKIAKTDFAIIERILRKNITVSSLEEARWTLNKMLQDPELSEEDRKEAKKQLDEVNLMDDKEFLIDKTLVIIKAKQAALREALKIK